MQNPLAACDLSLWIRVSLKVWQGFGKSQVKACIPHRAPSVQKRNHKHGDRGVQDPRVPISTSQIIMPTWPEAWEYERTKTGWEAEKKEKQEGYLCSVEAQVWLPPCPIHYRMARSDSDQHRCMPPPFRTLGCESHGPERWGLRSYRALNSLLWSEMPRQRTQKGTLSWSNTRFVFYVLQTVR